VQKRAEKKSALKNACSNSEGGNEELQHDRNAVFQSKSLLAAGTMLVEAKLTFFCCAPAGPKTDSIRSFVLVFAGQYPSFTIEYP